MKAFKLLSACFFFVAFAIAGHARAPCCKVPAQGPAGVTGIPGPTGPTGATGAQGPVGANNFAYVTFVFSGTSQIVPAQGTIIFPSANVVQGNILYNPLTGIFTLTDTGSYFVHYGITGSPTNDQVALKLNSNVLPIPGSLFDLQNSILQGIGVVFNVTVPLSSFRAINNETSGNITISTTNVGSVTAYLFIRQL